jgi:hypothetical protein
MFERKRFLGLYKANVALFTRRSGRNSDSSDYYKLMIAIKATDPFDSGATLG